MAAEPRGETPPPGPGPGLPPGYEDFEREFGRGGTRGLPDLHAVIALLEGLRTAVPRELQDQFASLLREVLLTVRALIDFYLERLDGRRDEPQVEDIPID